MAKHIRRLSPPSRRSRSGAWSLLAGVLLLGAHMPLPANGGENEPAGLDNTRATLEKWIEVRQLISREKNEFKLARQMLLERIALLRGEVESLSEKIAVAEESIGEADRKRLTLTAENDQLKTLSSLLGGRIAGMETAAKTLLGRLPEPILEHVKPLSQRLPETSSESKLSLSQRFQNILGILNEINKFNREITLVSEVRELPGGGSVEVAALYFGLGQGYYSGADGTIAGVGFATESGWQWQPANEHAAAIADAIAIFKNEKIAAFVQLPAIIR